MFMLLPDQNNNKKKWICLSYKQGKTVVTLFLLDRECAPTGRGGAGLFNASKVKEHSKLFKQNAPHGQIAFHNNWKSVFVLTAS